MKKLEFDGSVRSRSKRLQRLFDAAKSGMGEHEYYGMLTDLNDVYEICGKYLVMMEDYLSRKSVSDGDLYDLVIELQSELVDHIGLHRSGLKKRFPRALAGIEKKSRKKPSKGPGMRGKACRGSLVTR